MPTFTAFAAIKQCLSVMWITRQWHYLPLEVPAWPCMLLLCLHMHHVNRINAVFEFYNCLSLSICGFFQICLANVPAAYVIPSRPWGLVQVMNIHPYEPCWGQLWFMYGAGGLMTYQTWTGVIYSISWFQLQAPTPVMRPGQELYCRSTVSTLNRLSSRSGREYDRLKH